MKKIKNDIRIISEDVTLLLENGDHIMLETNDNIIIKRNADILKEKYYDAVKIGDTEKAEAIANELEKLGISL